MLRPESDLRPAQRWARAKILATDGLILAWDCGSGKTIAVLSALRSLLDAFEARKVLVVAPLLVAETVWPTEVAEWAHTAALAVSVVTGSEDERIAALARPAEIYVINRENLQWLWRWLERGETWDFDTLVIDESTIAKSGRTRGANKEDKNGVRRRGPLTRFGVLAAARKKVRRIVLMTGTPAPNGLRGLWGQAYLVDLGERLGATMTAFERRWFTQDRYGWKVTPHAHSEKEILEQMADVMFSLGPEDYVDLPPLVTNLVKVRLAPKALAEYRTFARTLVSEPYDVEAVNKGVLTNKLLQFANGSMYREDGEHVWVHDEKLAALQAIVEESGDEPILVAYAFRFDLERIRRVYPSAVALGEENGLEVVGRWNRGEIPLLLAHRASAGHGLNLQHGGHIVVQYGLTHDLELYLQFNKRLHRAGQKRAVFNHHIVAEKTVDEIVWPLFLKPKSNLQNRVLEAVRVRLDEQA